MCPRVSGGSGGEDIEPQQLVGCPMEGLFPRCLAREPGIRGEQFGVVRAGPQYKQCHGVTMVTV